MNARFNPVNQPSRAKRKEIPEKVWEHNKKVVLRELSAGNSIEKVAKWICDQSIVDFNPR